MKTLIVGDVQGCREELEELLQTADLDPQRDALIFVGDLVAKGPDSRGVLKVARAWNARAVKGNHEAHVLKFRRGERGEMKKHHLDVARTLDEADWKYLEAMPLWLRLPQLGIVVVHAGLVPGIALEQQEENALLNIRSLTKGGGWSKRYEDGDPWPSKWKGPERIVFGHDATRGLQRWPFALGLDTGCCYGKALTGLLLPDDVLVSVPARRAWVPIDE